MITYNFISQRLDSILAARGTPMIVDWRFRHAVAFLCEDDKDGMQPIGTVFFVSVPLDLSRGNISGFSVYAITAYHCICDYAESDVITIRAHDKGGSSYQDIETKKSEWISHPDTDVAICDVTQRYSDSGVQSFSFEYLKPSDPSKPSYALALWEGDDVFTIGLFDMFAGERRIQPIARYGKVALRPNEKVLISMKPDPKVLTPIDAYLIEMETWEGQSGSPVFAYFLPDPQEHLRGSFSLGHNKPFLIGLIHGFYKGDAKRRNKGIAVVVPTESIIDLLMKEDVLKQRQLALEQKLRERPVPERARTKREDSVLPKADEGITREGFEDALKRASRRVSSSNEEALHKKSPLHKK